MKKIMSLIAIAILVNWSNVGAASLPTTDSALPEGVAEIIEKDPAGQEHLGEITDPEEIAKREYNAQVESGKTIVKDKSGEVIDDTVPVVNEETKDQVNPVIDTQGDKLKKK